MAVFCDRRIRNKDEDKLTNRLAAFIELPGLFIGAESADASR
jgi:hypothetical protein